MTAPDPPLPPAPGPLRVQGSSKLAFGATTAALVTLATGGTAVLVAQATSGVRTPTSLPPGALPPDDTGVDGLVVSQQPGATVAERDPTEKALRDALAHRREPGRRTLTAPLVPVGPQVPRQVDPTPEVEPPSVEPPSVERPSVEPPSVQPPTVEPPGVAPHYTVRAKHGHAYGHDKKPRHLRPASHGKGRHAR